MTFHELKTRLVQIGFGLFLIFAAIISRWYGYA